MNELESHWLLSIDEKSYQQKYFEINLGADLASGLARTHGFFDRPIRIPAGSSLVFRLGTEHFLKLTPPFLFDSIEAESLAAFVIGDQLPFHTPKIVIEGLVGSWSYVVTKRVPGQQAKNVFGKMNSENRMLFAADIGLAIKTIRDIKTAGFERKFGPWENYLSNRLSKQKAVHLEVGNHELWADQINTFVSQHSETLQKLGPAKLIHADLNPEHIILDEKEQNWRLSGVINFTDAMNAPVEMEFVMPILYFFRGKIEFQKKIFESAKFCPNYKPNLHSNVMMALALQNRSVKFQDWFDREIKAGAETIEDIASLVFPVL